MTDRSPWGDFRYSNIYPDADAPPRPTDNLANPPSAWGDWQALEVAAGHAETEYVTRDLVLAWHPQQWKALVESQARFRVIAAGVGWGKTIALSQYMLKRAMLEGGVYWWVAPTYALASIAQHDYFAPLIERAGIAAEYNRSKKYYLLPNGATIHFKSADDPKNLVGQRLKGLVVDEASRCLERAWTDGLRGRLTGVPGSWAIFISSPNGHDWFYRLFVKGRDPAEREWESFRFGTAGNPMIDPAELESARRDLPRRFFLQNYEAVFFGDGAGMFPGLDAVLVPIKKPIIGRYFVHSWDVAETEDFNAIGGWDTEDRHPVYFDRHHRMGLEYTYGIVEQRFRSHVTGQLWMDQTGIGRGAFAEMVKRGISVAGVNFSNEVKRLFVTQYQHAIETKQMWLPGDGPHAEVFLEEHRSFRISMTARGRPVFEAPPGYNDDTVTMGMLGWQGLQSCPRLGGGDLFLVGSGVGDMEGRDEWPGSGL